MTPYRGFVVVREVMDRAITSGIAALVSAMEAAHRPREPRRSSVLDGADDVLRAVLAPRGFVAVEVSKDPLDRVTIIRARHRCRSIAVGRIDEHDLLVCDTGEAVDMVARTLDGMGCYCVAVPL